MKRLLFLLFFLTACTTQNTQVNLLRPADFRSLIQEDKVFVIDTHIPEQQHIEGTDAFIPYNAIQDNIDKLPEDKDTSIAVYCRSGSMSAQASRELTEMGYTNVYDLQGGANAWRAAGYEFEVN